MNTSHAEVAARKKLEKAFGFREAKSIWRLLKEDLLDPVKKGEPARYEEVLEESIGRLLVNEPVQYITGVADFYGLKFHVNRHVLIPRPETEELVDWILSDLKAGKRGKGLNIIDLGTGSGCIAIILKKYLPKAQVTGLDYSSRALAVAKENARQLGLSVEFIRGNILETGTLPMSSPFDCIVSNPPYIGKDEAVKLPENVKRYEPEIALFSPVGADPLVYYEKISEYATKTLKSDGYIYLEMSEFNAEKSKTIVEAFGFETIMKRDMQGKERMLRAGY